MAKQDRQTSADSGMTILESVLVLAVVGIIIGAIWAGYKTINNDAKMTNGTRQANMLLKATRDYLANQNENSMGASTTGLKLNEELAYGAVGATNAIKGSVPSDIKINGTGNNTQLQTDLGNLDVKLYSNPNTRFNSPRIVITYLSVGGSPSIGRGVCISLIQAMAGDATAVQNLGLVSIQLNQDYDVNDGQNLFNDVSVTAGFIPVDTAQSKCQKINKMNFAFNLRG